MNKKLRSMALLVVFMLVFGFIAGCSGVQTTQSQATSATTKGSETTAPTTAGTTAEPVKLTMYMYNTANKINKDYNECAGMREVQKRAGVELILQTPAAGSDANATAQQFNIMLASGTYPDMFFWFYKNYPGGITKLVDDGIVIKLNDLIDKSAPNFKKALADNPLALKQLMLDDGSIPYFPKIEPDLKRMAYNGFQLRKDWLDKLNMEVPKTIDEWYTLLKAFKATDLNGNGKSDEIPFGEQSGLGGLQSFSAAWGLYTFGGDFSRRPETGKICYAATEPEYKDYLATMIKWYDEGLIGSEFPSVDSSAMDAGITGETWCSWFSQISRFSKYTGLMKDKNPKFEMVGAPPPIGPAGKAYSPYHQLISPIDDGLAISTQCKNLDAAIRYADYCYSEDGRTLMNYGFEGETYTVVDGKKIFTDKILKTTEMAPSDYIQKWALPLFGYCKLMDINATAQFEIASAQAAREAWLNPDISTELLLPANFNLTSDESKKYAEIMSDVDTYRKEMFLKFILGKESLDKFDEYVSTIKGMNVAEAVAIRQAAYDRYLARK